jgi:hypothetical protein
MCTNSPDRQNQIGIYLTVTTHHVILSEAAQSAAKSKNPFSLRCFLGDGSFDSLRSLRMTVVVVTQLCRFEQYDKLKFEGLQAVTIREGPMV